MKKYLVTWISPSGYSEKRFCENNLILRQLLRDVVRTLQTYDFSISSFTIKSIWLFIMKKFWILKTFLACLISFSFAVYFCTTFNGFVSVSVFGGLFLSTIFGVFNIKISLWTKTDCSWILNGLWLHDSFVSDIRAKKGIWKFSREIFLIILHLKNIFCRKTRNISFTLISLRIFKVCVRRWKNFPGLLDSWTNTGLISRRFANFTLRLLNCGRKDLCFT